jgi:hypothetical protein
MPAKHQLMMFNTLMPKGQLMINMTSELMINLISECDFLFLFECVCVQFRSQDTEQNRFLKEDEIGG